MKFTSCTIVKNRQDACPTRDEFSCGTGKMPVPKQEWCNISVETFCLIQTPLLRWWRRSFRFFGQGNFHRSRFGRRQGTLGLGGGNFRRSRFGRRGGTLGLGGGNFPRTRGGSFRRWRKWCGLWLGALEAAHPQT